MKSLDLFAHPSSQASPPVLGGLVFATDAELEAAIEVQFQRIVMAPDYASRLEPCTAMRLLIEQRTAARIKKMEVERGLAR